ncbi:uncharacterized protein C11orf16 homolog isoform X2 [Triplophysa dalaica]|uniref:uncharacterized protein C11orf16 homolog isoform X2 n=1 Tax=Triplophysa dalaica TaxID=1582913 RepID=UPI0024DFAE15|nr:uncharacterized protein C11orf16 homolog isoform X2 [Triplophysa dalaica]
MSSSPHVSYSQSVLPLFMGKSRNTTFVLDTSNGMNAFMGPVKNLIIQTLTAKASLRDSLFNIISVSYKATAWSSHMLLCTPDIVYQALNWIHTLQTSPGRDLYTALALAFSDPACQSVHLVTSGLPDNTTQCLASLSTLVTRPVHTFHISDNPMNGDISDFLHCVSSTTKGSCYNMSVNSGNVVEIQTPSYLQDRWPSGVDLNHVPYYNSTSYVCSAPYWCSPTNHFSTVSCASTRVMRGAEFHPGCRVLARSERDGFYYLGTIIHQGRGNVYMVEFDKVMGPIENAFMETINAVQPTYQPDMVSLSIAHGHSIAPGDTVLVPWEPDLTRYGPGRVISGMELRDSIKGDDVSIGPQVRFWNGITMHVPKDLAVWIPASHHEQVIKDLQYYSTRPCCCRVSHCNSGFKFPSHRCTHHSLSCIPPCHCPVKTCWPIVMSTPLLNKHGREDLERKIDLQLKELQSLQVSSSSDSDDQQMPSSSEMVSASINTEISCLKKPYTQLEVKPAWRYWKRGSPEPQHKKPGRTVRSSHVNRARHIWDSGNSTDDHSMMTNHSSLFKMIPISPKRGASIRELFQSTDQKSFIKASSPIVLAMTKRPAKAML